VLGGGADAGRSGDDVAGGAGEPLRLNGLRASAGFFPALGIEPMLGRAFNADTDSAGHEHVAILSYSLWRDHFGGDSSILGRSVR